MKTDNERQFEAESSEITALANETLALNASAAAASLAKRREAEKAEAEAEAAALKEAKAKRRAGVLGNVPTPVTA